MRRLSNWVSPRLGIQLLTRFASLNRRGKSAEESGVASPSIPDGTRIYAFGDVHGRHDLLSRLRDEVMRSVSVSPPARAIVVGLGDYIDRGPDSRGVLELLTKGFGNQIEHVLLRGNHEELLARFLQRPEDNGKTWFRIGGLELLRSYDIDIRPYVGANPNLERARGELVQRLPPHHRRLLETLPTSFVLGDYVFVHAGLRVGVPLTEQSIDDLLWLREGFADRDQPFEKIVVHGHTPTKAPYFGRYRINIDTGAFATNKLTCIVLEGDQRHVLQASD